MIVQDGIPYSLILKKSSRILYRSTQTGLRPLVECIEKNKGKKGCTLYDKIIGLAAAKLIVYSGMIKTVSTSVASLSAIQFLKEYQIEVQPLATVSSILNQKHNDVCPFEKKAQTIHDPIEFYETIKKVLLSV